MDDILENDRTNIDLMSTPILALCVIMVILTLIGLIGTQLQLMNLYKQVAFSLAMTGMNWGAWKASWLSIFCLPLWLASLIGAFLGSAWKSVVMLERMNAFTPTAFAISVAIVLLSAIGILPTIGRWSRIDIKRIQEVERMKNLRLEGVTKVYDPGKSYQVDALRGIDAEFESGRSLRDHGRIRIGQIHIAEHSGMSGSPVERQLSVGRAANRTLCPQRCSPKCVQRISVLFCRTMV